MDLPLEDGSNWTVPQQFQQELAEVAALARRAYKPQGAA